jgi:formiminotetrahydrofolate cyclodeaminase
MTGSSKKMKRNCYKFKGYLEDLAKKAPSPGGGSAVCLVLCLGVSLLEKAIRYSTFRDNRFKKHLDILKKLREKVYSYIALDGKIFERILLTKGAKRSEFIVKSQRLIIDTGKTSIKVFSIAKKVESGIKKSIISDFYIGKEFIKVALEGCIFTLEANRDIFKVDSEYINIFKKYLKKWERS